jgi:hypothetical protein
MRIHVPRTIALFLVWLGFISSAMLAAMGDLLPFGLGSMRPESAFTCLIEAELFFVLAIWPFFIPRVVVPRVEVPPGVSGEGHLLMLQVCVMFVVAMPLAFLSQNLASIGAREFFVGHLLVATAAAFVAAVFGTGPERPSRVTPWYFLGFFVLSGLVPFAHYLSLEYSGTSLAALSAVSPFWSASELDRAAPLVASAIFGVGALAIFLGSAMRPAVAAKAA